MKEKHVTIDRSFPGTPNGEARSEHNIPSHDTISRQGTTNPRLTLSSGQDGYRTPTVEEYELNRDPNMRGQRSDGLSNNNLHYSRHPGNPSNVSLAHSILDELQWRERIRHYTWTFSTITMAAGGISNVLYTDMVEDMKKSTDW